MHLPKAFIERTKALFGNELWEIYIQSFEEKKPVSIRFNPYKTTIDQGQTATQFPLTEQVPWASHAWYLAERPAFISDPLFHAGCYYVQEAASMFLESFIKMYVQSPVICLDLCAAPGGKSTQLSSILSEGSLLVANEVIRSRANILTENLIKWGNPASIVVNNDPEQIGRLTHFFDLIVADVPCSGEGMFRKNPAAVSEWSLDHVKFCSDRQRRIIASVWNSLKPGGILIYSTCTYNMEENDDNIEWIKDTYGATSLAVPLKKEWNVQGNVAGYRFIPGKTQGEGFFIAAVKKNEDEIEGSHYLRSSSKKIPAKNDPCATSIRHWLTGSDYDFEWENQNLLAIPSLHREAWQRLKDRLKIIYAGITLGAIKGNNIAPGHTLAMSLCFCREAFPSIDINTETALSYLRKQTIQLPGTAPKGYILLTYKNFPLGFVKNIGNRANNLYPQEWRIRSIT